MSTSVEQKKWANHLRTLLGGECSVYEYRDEDEKESISVFSSRNSDGIVAATVGLMEIDQSLNEQNPIFTEIIIDQRSSDDRIENILSTIAFYIIKNGWRIAPSVIFEQMIEMYFPNHSLPHVIFVPPFQWESMSKVDLNTKTIYPLVAVPISEDERLFVMENEDRALEKLWEDRGIDVLDWGRNSAV